LWYYLRAVKELSGLEELEAEARRLAGRL
jgi:hypothetical protein